MSNKKLTKNYYAVMETSATTDVADAIAIYEEATTNDTFASAEIAAFDIDKYDDAKAMFDANYSKAVVATSKEEGKYDVTFWELVEVSEYTDENENTCDMEVVETSEFPE